MTIVTYTVGDQHFYDYEEAVAYSKENKKELKVVYEEYERKTLSELLNYYE